MARKSGRRTGTTNKGGFTLIELLVSIAIFSIITVTVVVNFRSSQRATQLRLAAEEVVSLLHELQTMAQTGRRIELCASGSSVNANWVCTAGQAQCGTLADCALRVPAGGYGLYVEGSRAWTFADSISGGRSYDAGEALRSGELVFPVNIEIDTSQTPDGLTIIFAPPEPRVWISGSASSERARIVLRHALTGQTRAAVVYRATGRIDVE